MVIQRESGTVVLLIAFLSVWFSIYTFQAGQALQSQIVGIAAFVFFVSIYLLLGVPRLVEKLKERIDFSRVKVLGLALGLAGVYALYALLVDRFRWTDLGACALYLLIPAILLLITRPGEEGLTLQDLVAILALCLPLALDWLRLEKVPVAQGEEVGKILGLIWGVFLFLVVRRLEGVGYTFQLDREDARQAGLHFALFAVFFAIPIAVPTHFAASTQTMKPIADVVASLVIIAFFIALPEELLFRGIFHNLLSKRLKGKPHMALAISSLLFGLSHVHSLHHPDWVYVILATIAGGFYGLTYVRTGKVTAAAITHWLVDSYWRLFFQS